ncbi:late embryogenesis abundant protein 46-like [Solanum verrucosum]|nr:late embryogenesis abundant protein 46-like [Solanum verrucosum]
MQAMKETATNIKSGIEKTKAVAQEMMTAKNPSEKEMATEKKEERIKAAEGKTHSYSTSGATGQPSGAHQMSALPGHGSGQPTGGSVVEGVVPSHPIGKATGTHNTHVGS